MQSTIFKILFTCIFSLLMSFGFSKKETPKYKDIILHFYRTYDTGNDKFSFSKKKQGYYVNTLNKKNRKIIKQELFWSRLKGKYINIKIKKVKDGYIPTKELILDKYFNDHDSYYFDLMIFYNYYGWKEDVLKKIEGEKKLTDDELYALGKIYALKSQEILNQNQTWADTTFSKLPESGSNLISPDRLSLYKKYSYKSIEYHKALHQQNPNYSTFIGSIKNKYEDMYVSMYRELLTFQNEEEAKKVLVDSLYDPLIINYAKNVLNSCSKNAILFTHGDNDTHPLMYIQAQYSFRQDVTVINTSLLNTANYINFLRTPSGLPSTPIKLSLKKTKYLNDSLSYVFCKAGYDSIKSFRDVIDYWNSNQLKNEDNSKTYIIPKKELTLPIDGSHYIEVSITNPYLTRSQFIRLDIIDNNQHLRDIYTTHSYNSLVKSFYQPLGLVYKYTQKDLSDSLKENLLHKYKYSYTNPSNLETTNYPNFQTQIASSVRYSFYKLSYQLKMDSKNTEAKKLMKHYFLSFPLNDFPLTLNDLSTLILLQNLKMHSFVEDALRKILNTKHDKRFFETLKFYNTNYKGALQLFTDNLRSYSLDKEFNKLIEESKSY